MPRKRTLLLTGVLTASALLISGCSMMAKMMGKGDLMGAMQNMDKVMKDMPAKDRMAYMQDKQAETLTRGKVLFGNTSLGTNGQSCNSCHPGGKTTGGEAEVPMSEYRLPIPTLIGASATFPRNNVPNDRVITLAEMNNNCIKMFMGGKALGLESEESIALNMYVSSLSNGEAVNVQASR
jgi:cytochrome c